MFDCAKKRKKLKMKWAVQTQCRNSDLSRFISAPITYLWVIHKNVVSLAHKRSEITAPPIPRMRS
jgi:hypothetical protein